MKNFEKKEKSSLKKSVDKIKKVYNKKITKSKMKFNMSETILFMLITFAFGIVLGGIIMYGKGMFGSNSSLYEFAATYNELISSYYQDVDSDELLKAGISGMVRYLGDPYSTYMDSETAESFNDEVEGIYHGIGAEIKYDDNFKVVSIGKVFENSPASRAGLQADDVLIKVEDEEISGKSLSEISDRVKGPDGTKVNITIIRDGVEKTLTITRGTVDNVSVNSEIIERDGKKIGYIRISIFAANTGEQFKKELANVEKENIDSLIIDVRGNTGGYLTTVDEIISLFIKNGEVIYQLKTKDKIEKILDETKDERNYKIAVLVDSGSASASEVLTAALKETYKAEVIGTTTFGKGRVQKVYTLSNGAMVKYTFQEWLSPDGNEIDGKGITPTIEEKYVYDESGYDNQKEKAIEVLLEK